MTEKEQEDIIAARIKDWLTHGHPDSRAKFIQFVRERYGYELAESLDYGFPLEEEP